VIALREPPLRDREQPDGTVLHTLALTDIHVWSVDTDREAMHLARLWATLSPDERARASRMRSSTLQARHAVAHGALRAVLAGYLSVEAAELRFAYGDHGKPTLAAGFHSGGLRFNLSHSDNRALIAVALGREVGVDIERMRDEVEAGDLARRWFAPLEAAAMAQLGATEERAAFFRTWARKEAYLKARGFGLSRSPRTFEIPDPGLRQIGSVRDLAEPEASGRWTYRDLAVGEGWAAAVVAEGEGWTTHLREWRGADTP
jgi:4'-phosphopantetheinyl transferase